MGLSKAFTFILFPALVLAALAVPAQAADGDGDGIDDAVEEHLCARTVTQDAFNTHTGGAVGRCNGSKDFQPSSTVDDAVKTVSDALEDIAPVQALHALLCQFESKDRELDGHCAAGDDGLRYSPPGLANISRGLQALIGPAPVVCHDSADPTDVLTGTVDNADCDERSNSDELNRAIADPQGFVAAPRCDNPLLHENETTDCTQVVDPGDLEPGEDGPYPCVLAAEPQDAADAVVNNVDCDERSNFDEINGALADPAAFAADPTKNNPLLPE